MKNKKLILVDLKDQSIGKASKLDVHLGKGTLHRAFTTIIQNEKNEFLLTKRSLKKPLWPTYWDLSFSSHPWEDEDLKTACLRRAKEELGISLDDCKEISSYHYQISWSDIFAEHEINHILHTKYYGNLNLNPEEISDYKWLTFDKLQTFLKDNEYIAPWVIEFINKTDKNKLQKSINK
jgi:isopentenyl-diphosphate delta-isomerase